MDKTRERLKELLSRPQVSGVPAIFSIIEPEKMSWTSSDFSEADRNKQHTNRLMVPKEGYLWKSGGKKRKTAGHWQKRWFVLKDGVELRYFKQVKVPQVSLRSCYSKRIC